MQDRNQELVQRLQGKVNLQDTLLWWVACGIDAVDLIAKAVDTTGSSTSEAITGHWSSLTNYPGYFGNFTFTATERNGYPTSDVVMSAASTARNGTFALAASTPGNIALHLDLSGPNDLKIARDFTIGVRPAQAYQLRRFVARLEPGQKVTLDDGAADEDAALECVLGAVPDPPGDRGEQIVL